MAAAKWANVECFLPSPSFGRRVCVDWWSAAFVDDAIPVVASLYLAAERPATKDPEHASATTPRPYATVLSETPLLLDDDDDDVETFSSHCCKDNNVALSSSPRRPFSAAAWYDVVDDETIFPPTVFIFVFFE